MSRDDFSEDDLRELLEICAVSEPGRLPEADEVWRSAGRIRRRRQAGAVVGGMAAAAVLFGALSVSQLLGPDDARETLADPTRTEQSTTPVVALPGDRTTYVLVRDGSGAVVDRSVPLTTLSADQLAGTRWVLQDRTWAGGPVDEQLTGGADVGVSLDQTAGGTSGLDLTVELGACSVTETLTLADHGTFLGSAPGQEGDCEGEQARARDAWTALLGQGGELLDAGQDVLLISLAPLGDDTVATTAPPDPAQETAVAPTSPSGTAPGTDEATGQDTGTAAPSAGPTTTDDPTGPSGGDPAGPSPEEPAEPTPGEPGLLPPVAAAPLWPGGFPVGGGAGVDLPSWWTASSQGVGGSPSVVYLDPADTSAESRVEVRHDAGGTWASDPTDIDGTPFFVDLQTGGIVCDLPGGPTIEPFEQEPETGTGTVDGRQATWWRWDVVACGGTVRMTPEAWHVPGSALLVRGTDGGKVTQVLDALHLDAGLAGPAVSSLVDATAAGPGGLVGTERLASGPGEPRVWTYVDAARCTVPGIDPFSATEVSCADLSARVSELLASGEYAADGYFVGLDHVDGLVTAAHLTIGQGG